MMVARHHRLIRLVPGALGVLVLLGCLAWPFMTIQLRLSRNGAIARQLVESLHTKFPGAEFRGVAAYNREVVYITVVSGPGEGRRRDVEQWLRRLKAELNIAPGIELRFPQEVDDKDTIRIEGQKRGRSRFLILNDP